MSKSWTDLYTLGERMNFITKTFDKKLRHAEAEDNDLKIEIWGEALRKVLNDQAALAKTVLSVEQLVKGKYVHTIEP